MATTCTIDRLSGIYLKRITQTFARSQVSFGIPGGRGAVFDVGTHLPAFTAEFAISETTTALARTKATQLQEIESNLNYQPVYITWSGDETPNDGWYIISEVRFEVAREFASVRPFTANLTYLGGTSNYRIATIWGAAAETVTGANWAGALTANKLIALPYNVTNINWAVTETRTTIDGSNQVLLNPTRAEITYKSSATVADWSKAECKVYDTVTPGETTEANWVQVYSDAHTFTGDVVIQNGMIRYKIGASATNFYVLDTVASPDAWVDGGAFKIYYDATNEATLNHYEITELSPDLIRWREIRQYSTNTYPVEYAMQRGAKHFRVRVISSSYAYARLAGTNYYDEWFNKALTHTINGYETLLDTDLDSNYICAYNATRDIVVGFALTFQPTSTTVSADNDNFYANNLPSTYDSVFCVFGFSQETNPFVIATARTTAAAIAAQCLYAVEQEISIIPRGWYV